MILSNVRTPDERRGDLNAQVAALRIGERRVREMIERHGFAMVTQGFAAILDYAERRMLRRIRELPQGVYTAEDFP